MAELVNNPASITAMPGGAFTFDPVTNAAYTSILAIINDPTTGMPSLWGADWRDLPPFEQVKRLRIWLRRWLDRGLWYGDSGYSHGEQAWATFPEMLAWHNAGGDGRCTYHSVWFVWCCQAIGLPARRQSWYCGDPTSGEYEQGDNNAEVYCSDKGKWVAVSAVANMWWSLGDSVPLSAVEMCYLYHTDIDTYKAAITCEYDDELLALVPPNQSWQNAQGEHTYPTNGVIDDPHNWVPLPDVAGYAWDVMPCNSNTYGIWNVYNRYVAPGWPYDSIDRFAPTWVQGQQTTNRTWFEFDANKIRLAAPVVDNTTLTVTVADGAVANFSACYIRLKDVAGATITTESFGSAVIGASVTIDTTGADTAEVWAQNTRGGRSNVVTITGLTPATSFDAHMTALLDDVVHTFDAHISAIAESDPEEYVALVHIQALDGTSVCSFLAHMRALEEIEQEEEYSNPVNAWKRDTSEVISWVKRNTTIVPWILERE